MVYLDNAATTPLSNDMKAYLSASIDEYGNPSSLYKIGRKTKYIIDDTRKRVAEFINANAANIYFTAGGSASNSLAIKGYSSKNNCCVLYSPIAHKSILKCVESCDKSAPLIVNNNGVIDLHELERLCMMNPRALVVIDYANSEIGIIQDVRRIIEIVHFYKGIVYLDCTASIGTIPLDIASLDVDMCGFSAHKLRALKGCGVLYKKEEIVLEPLIYGSQEGGLIGGTENVLGIVSLNKAICEHRYDSVSANNRDYVYQYIIQNISDCYLVGSFENRLVHNLYMCFKGVDGESLVMLLDINNIQVSTGSACNNNSIVPSPTLTAIGISPDDIHSCIRMTFNGHENKEDLDYVCETLKKCVHNLRSLM